MFAFNYLLPVLAASGFAAAQNTLCAVPTLTITNAVDATALASCTSVQTIVISSSASGEIVIPNGITTMAGINATSASLLTRLSAPSVSSITGAFTLANLPILSSLEFPQLSSVGSIAWSTISINTLVFTKGVTKATDVTITNTQLSSLTGIDLSVVNSMTITNNPNLRSISSQLGGSLGTVIIGANGPSFALSFPNLTSAGGLDFEEVSTLSIPKLGTVATRFYLLMSSVSTFLAPNLTTVGGDFSFQNNTALTNITCPKLTSVGSLTIINDTSLLDISGFPALSTTPGAINVVGNYTNFVLPSLTHVQGTFNAQSSGNFSCVPFDALAANKGIQGQRHCTPNSGQVSTDVNGGAPSGTAPAATATSTKGAAATVRPGSILPMLSVTALVGGLIMAGGLFRFAL